jgi:hypothetical protein
VADIPLKKKELKKKKSNREITTKAQLALFILVPRGEDENK